MLTLYFVHWNTYARFKSINITNYHVGFSLGIFSSSKELEIKINEKFAAMSSMEFWAFFKCLKSINKFYGSTSRTFLLLRL